MYNTLRRIREEKAAEDRGFTLIELLVVVVIIGILVAIAIPLYLNYRDGANNKSLESDVRNAAPAVEQFYADHNNYPATGTDLTDDTPGTGVGAHVGDNTTLTYKTVGGGYCIKGTNSDATDTYYYASATGKVNTTAC